MLPLISLRVDCTRRASLRTVIRARITACLVSVLLNSTNATCRTEVLCCYSNTVRFVAMRGGTAGPVDVSLALAISGTETCHAVGDAAVTKSKALTLARHEVARGCFRLRYFVRTTRKTVSSKLPASASGRHTGKRVSSRFELARLLPRSFFTIAGPCRIPILRPCGHSLVNPEPLHLGD